MNEKRLRKLNAAQEPRRPLRRGRARATRRWRSSRGVPRPGSRSRRSRSPAQSGLQVKALIPRLLYPVAEEVYHDFLASVKRGLVVEQSHQGQLYRLIRMYVDVPKGLESFARSGSNPFSPVEIVDRLRAQARAVIEERQPVSQAE